MTVKQRINKEMIEYWRKFWLELNTKADFDKFFAECPSVWYLIDEKGGIKQ